MTAPDHDAPLVEPDDTIAAAAADLGPFDPPADYEFEPELQDQPPRPVPAEVRRGRHGQGQRRTAWGLLVAGLLCLLFSALPAVQLWALFVLPLEFLHWVGLGLAALSLPAFVALWSRRGPYRYVEEGVPLVARVESLTLLPVSIINGTPATYRFDATIQYRDPATGEAALTRTGSNDFSAGAKDHLTTTYRAGDYVTAVYLAHDPAKTLRLYGFLGLRPGLGLVRREGAPEPGPLKSLLLICAIFGFFFILGWNVYAFGRYSPLDATAAMLVPGILGATLLGLPALVLVVIAARWAEKRRAERNEQALAAGEAVELSKEQVAGGAGFQGWFLGVVCIAGSLLLGAVTMMCWAFTANALLDRSPPTARLVQVKERWITTHSFIFREYTIEYAMPGDAETHKFLSTPDHMAQFQTDLAIAEVHEGWFGWPWVKDIQPLNVVLNPPGQRP